MPNPVIAKGGQEEAMTEKEMIVHEEIDEKLTDIWVAILNIDIRLGYVDRLLKARGLPTTLHELHEIEAIAAKKMSEIKQERTK